MAGQQKPRPKLKATATPPPPPPTVGQGSPYIDADRQALLLEHTRRRAAEAGLDPPPPPPRSIYHDMGVPFTMRDRDDVSSWLQRVLNPSRLPASADRRLRQIYSVFFPSWTPGGNDPTLNLALRRISDQYPQATTRSTTVSTSADLGPQTAAVRHRNGLIEGRIQLRNELIPQDTDQPPVWRDKMHDLMSTLAHELSHGMGLPDEGTPDAYDVSRAYDRLSGDVHLPTERPAAGVARRTR